MPHALAIHNILSWLVQGMICETEVIHLGFCAAGQSIQKRPLDIEHNRYAFLQQELLSISGDALFYQQHVWLVVCHSLYSDPQMFVLLHCSLLCVWLTLGIWQYKQHMFALCRSQQFGHSYSKRKCKLVMLKQTPCNLIMSACER